jgi:hypothetical protein
LSVVGCRFSVDFRWATVIGGSSAHHPSPITHHSSMPFLNRLADAEWIDLAGRLLSVAVVLALALVVLGLVGRIRRRMVRRVDDLPSLDPGRQRALTVAALLQSTARYVVWGIATVMILGQLGMDIAPILAGAGVAGLAVGFGAQTLVKDVIAGVFLLFDNTLHVGDQITHAGHTGEVEYIGLRLVKIRTFDGELVMIPAGELRTFGNRSVGYSRAIVNVPIPAGEDGAPARRRAGGSGRDHGGRRAHGARRRAGARRHGRPRRARSATTPGTAAARHGAERRGMIARRCAGRARAHQNDAAPAAHATGAGVTA